MRAFIWGGGCPAASVRLTREYSEADHLFPLFSLAPDEVYPATCVTAGAVSSYLAFSTLPSKLGGVFSVALSVGLPPLGVTQHPVLWSSDFPH